MTDPLSPEERDRLAAVIAAYGADPARWPAADRARLAHRLADAPSALRVEGEALDALIASSVEPAPPPGSLERLLARVSAAEALPPAPIALAVRRRPPLTSAPAWMALAASLLLGFWAGSAGLVDGVLLDAPPDGDWSAIDLSLRDDGDGA